MNLLDLMVRIGVDDQASSKVEGITSGAIAKGVAMGNAMWDVTKQVAGAAAGAVKQVAGGALQAYSAYEQMTGGVDKLFGDASGRLQAYAAQAYQTSGMSANQYMQQATSFSAALINSLGGDTAKAADMADVAMRAMSDNVNVFGSNAEDVQNAIMGISRQNYTMLDNLKLGYAGTKEGMQQLIKDANAWGAANGEASDLSIDSFADCVQAIQQVQEAQGIAGTTAKEAAGTIEGSVAMAKAAWEDYLTGIANPDADMGQLTQNLLDAIGAVAKNVGPRMVEIGNAIVEQLPVALTGLEQALEPVFTQAVAGAWNVAGAALSGLGIQLPEVDASQVEAAMGEVSDVVTGAWDAIEPVFSGIHDGLSGLLDGAFGDVSPEEVKAGLDSVHDGLKAVSDVVGGGIRDGLKAVGDALGALADASPGLQAAGVAIGTLAGGFTVLGAAMGLVSMGSLVSSIPVVAGLMSAWGAVTTAVGDAWAFLSLAMEANPIGVVVVAVAALVAALVYLYNTNETVRDAIDAAWQAIQSVVGAVVGAIVGFFTTTLPAAFQAVADFLTVTIPAAFQAFVDFMAGLPATIGAFIQQLPMLIVEGIGLLIGVVAGLVASLTVLAIQAGQAFLTNLVSFFMQLPGQVMAFLQSAVAFVASFAAQLAADAVQAGSSFLQGVVSFFTQLPGQLMAFLSSAIASIASFVAQVPGQAVAAGQGFLDGIQGGFNAAVSFVQGIPGQIMGFFSNAGSWLVDSGKALLDGFTNGIERGFQAAQDAVSGGLDFIRGFFPFSPAKRGPFSGHGYTTYSGAALMRDFAGSISGAVPSVAGAVGGALGAVRDQLSMSPVASLAPAMAAAGASGVAGAGATIYNLTIDGATVNGDEHVRGLFLDLLTELQRRAAMNVG